MKVYIITQGEYSDYSIRAVSLDKDDAERKCALLNRNARCGEYCEIEEYNTDDMMVETAEEVKKKFEMSVYEKTGDIIYFSEICLIIGDENKVKRTNGARCFGGIEWYIDVTATFPKDTTEEQAKKIMLDRVAKFKAERAGL